MRCLGLVSAGSKPYLELAVASQRTAGRIRGLKAARTQQPSGNALGRWLKRLAALFVAGPRDRRAALGAKGERMAVRRLRRHGYRIVARNFRAAGAEIDAIAMDGDTLVFVEVKTRTSFGAGSPQESVHGLKQNHIRRAAAVFARSRAMEERPMRFDVVAVSRADGRRWAVEIIKDAF